MITGDEKNTMEPQMEYNWHESPILRGYTSIDSNQNETYFSIFKM